MSLAKPIKQLKVGAWQIKGGSFEIDISTSTSSSGASTKSIAAGQSLTAQSFRVASKKALCLLSDSEVHVNLYGYCDFTSMLQHRLDKDTALVLASALEVATDTQETTFIVEHMVKVQDGNNLKIALDIEWKIVLLGEANKERDRYASPTKAEYWDREVKKLKRMVSEPSEPSDV